MLDTRYLMLDSRFGIRRYKQEFFRFLTYAIGSNDETIDHLENLFETESLSDEELYNDVSERLDKLGRKLNVFINSVSKGHLSER